MSSTGEPIREFMEDKAIEALLEALRRNATTGKILAGIVLDFIRTLDDQGKSPTPGPRPGGGPLVVTVLRGLSEFQGAVGNLMVSTGEVTEKAEKVLRIARTEGPQSLG